MTGNGGRGYHVDGCGNVGNIPLGEEVAPLGNNEPLPPFEPPSGARWGASSLPSRCKITSRTCREAINFVPQGISFLVIHC